MRGETLKITRPITFHVEECCACGVPFAMTEEFYEARMREKATGQFFCPNGHSQHYTGKSDRKLAQEAEERARQAELKLQVEVDQRLAAEAELKRQHARSKAGVCPCCKRSFVQLQRHMKTKHPEFPGPRGDDDG